jgi:CPA1 family monovalent cation:H+ antiporter
MTADFTPVLTGVAFAALIVALTAFGRKLPVPPPVLQVLAGIGIALLPGVRVPELEPDLVFFFFLPPILWAAAYFTSLREFRANQRPIGLLAIGLVLATSAGIAVAARALFPGMPWAVAVALGAIISPPDAVAASAIVSRLPVPRRVVVILEGESLVNDASALVLYRTAVAAAVTGFFSVGESVVRFFIDAGIGALIGIAIGWCLIAAARRTKDPLAETLLTLAGPYLAWVTAESLHVSAVLACVAGGLYTRQLFSTAVSPVSRVQALAVWELLVFVLNALIFVLLGLQVTGVARDVVAGGSGQVVVAGLVLGIVAIVIRLIWVPLATFLPRWLDAETRRKDPLPSPKAMFLVAWTSMRGIVSLAAALALPRTLADGSAFPYRHEILVVTICVIVLTLVVQGLSLAPIITRFAFARETTHHTEQRLARREAIRRAAEALEQAAREPDSHPADVEALRAELRERLRQHDEDGDRAAGRRRLRMALQAAERRVLVRLRNEGAISDEVLRELEQELDLEAMRLGSAQR